MAKRRVLSAENIYYNEIKYGSLLSNEEIYELGMKSKEGDIKAQLELFKGHLRFVSFIARRFIKRVKCLSYLDLIQVGNIALWRSIQTYDPQKGLLTTYAGFEIKTYIEYAIDKYEKGIYVPTYIQQAKRRYQRILESEGQKTDKEWLELLNCYSISEKTLEYVKNDREFEFISINELENKGVEIDYLSSFHPDYNSYVTSKISDYELFIFLKKKLPPFDYYILYYSTLIKECNFRANTAKKLGVSDAAIGDKKNQVLTKVRRFIFNKEKVLASMRDKEGKLYYRIKTEPIHPEDVTKYLYLKEHFTGIDAQILYEMFFGKYNLTDLEYARYFDMSLKEYLERIKDINDRISSIMQDETKYKDYINIIKEYRGRIYDIAINNNNILSLKKL